MDEAVAAFRRGDIAGARALAEQQLVTNPTPELHHLIGLIDCREGRLEAGIEWLRRASEAEPYNVGYRVMLARALLDSGQVNAALKTAVAPVGLSAAEVALWHVRAEAASAARAWAEAAEAWGRLCAIRRHDWRDWNSYGNALAAERRWVEAATALRRAAELNPDEDRLRRDLATALVEAGQFGEAEALVSRLIEAHKEEPSLRLLHAQIFVELNRYHEAMSEFDQAAHLIVTGAHAAGGLIAAAVGKGQAKPDDRTVRKIGLLLERTNQLDALGRLIEEARELGIAVEQLGYLAAVVALRAGDAEAAKRLLLTDPPEADPVRWHALMGKIEDALGDPAKAFAEAGAMNQSVDDFEEWRNRGGAYRQQLWGLAQTLIPQWVDSLPIAPPSERASPVFLVGFPRSGTTLMDTFLLGHPHVFVLEEMPMLAAAERVVGNLVDLPRRSRADIEAARSAYFEELERRADQRSAGVIVDKLPLNMLRLPLIYALFPDARVIFAQRHPCDCVLSCFMQDFVLNDATANFLDLRDAADLYDTAMRVWTASCELLPAKVHTVVYETLVDDPESALRPAINFLGLEWMQGLLDHRATALGRGAIATPSYTQVTQPLSKSPSGRWRRYEAQLAPVLPLLLGWAEQLGYEP